VAGSASPTLRGAWFGTGAPNRRFLVLASVAAALGFALACWLVDAIAHARVYGNVDDTLWVRPYWLDARLFLDGDVPYRNFPLEYPPLSLPVFILPALPPFGINYAVYRGWFEVLIAVIGMLIVPTVAWTLAWIGARRGQIVAALAAVAVSPVLTGPAMIARFDLWPALLAAVALAAMVAGRSRIAFVVLALGFLAKVYPGFLLPIFLIHAWRTAGRREAAIGLGLFVGVVAAGLGPFIANSPDDALAPFTRTLDRPLQVETLGASIMALLHTLAGTPLARPSDAFGSSNITGLVADNVARSQTLVLAACFAGIWLAMTRLPASPRTLVSAVGLAIVATVTFGKVLSPQYVTWLIPAVAVLVPARGVRVLALLAASLLLTTLYFPAQYGAYVHSYELKATLLVVSRNLVLVALAAYLLVADGTLPTVRRLWQERLEAWRPPSRPSPGA
jgi:uncharacterized membrane protein